MFRLVFRLVRALLVVALGSALAAKFVLQSNAEPETEEIDLVSIFEGKRLVSSADPFYGGQILTMFGGVLLDLRNTQPSPTGIRLNVAVIMGGISLLVPEGWRVNYEGSVYMGGWSDETKTIADEDVPTVTITGYVLMGGIQAMSRAAVEAAT